MDALSWETASRIVVRWGEGDPISCRCAEGPVHGSNASGMGLRLSRNGEKGQREDYWRGRQGSVVEGVGVRVRVRVGVGVEWEAGRESYLFAASWTGSHSMVPTSTSGISLFSGLG